MNGVSIEMRKRTSRETVTSSTCRTLGEWKTGNKKWRIRNGPIFLLLHLPGLFSVLGSRFSISPCLRRNRR